MSHSYNKGDVRPSGRIPITMIGILPEGLTSSTFNSFFAIS